MKSNWAILIAVCLALLAAIGVRKLIQDKIEDANRRLNKVSVVVASTQLPPGTTITDAMIAQGEALQSSAAGFVTWDDRGTVLGKQVYGFIDAGSVISKSLLRAPTTAPVTRVPAGQRLFTLPVDVSSGVAGLLGKDSFVDVLYVDSVQTRGGEQTVRATVLLRRVKVYDVGPDIQVARAGGGHVQTGNRYTAVTVLVLPQEAEMLAYCLDAGRIVLSKRSDTEPVGDAEYGGMGVTQESFDRALAQARALERVRTGQ